VAVESEEVTHAAGDPAASTHREAITVLRGAACGLPWKWLEKPVSELVSELASPAAFVEAAPVKRLWQRRH
jgi:hypothetical protein